ncbi:CADD family putative folate metabolism protein [Candidatus Fokinia crypta]|uniref:Heme oxygenase family protein n=1 Tax=Candidatus Fokinia crypta TaxID=1920990 RepID=A0ABZ0US84_9RICK|nr:CADD family putative folate metabolism protein [Candidatus Fokinia cryptica]WPX97889.1 Heme oxygenase family protein [Candidatus Fokinia cryptica]
MKFIEYLNKNLEVWFLLQHPFYQSWNHGKLTTETLVLYAQEYYHHVAAFPRYISQIHTLCNDIQDRQVLLDNLIDEERGENNHPELWLRFLNGLCNSRSISITPQLGTTKELVDGFFELVKADYETGLGALYAYERQTPAVAKSKIEGLKNHYNINDSGTLEFFTVHEKADEWHTEQLTNLICKLDEKSQQRVHEGAIEGAKLLWRFLDGISATYMMN